MPEPGHAEALQRHWAVERLLLVNPFKIKKPQLERSADPARAEEMKFWEALTAVMEFDSQRTGAETPNAKRTMIAKRMELLWAMRPHLQEHENRDILYAMVVIGQLRSLVPGFPDRLPLATEENYNEQDAANHLQVCKQFLERECTKSANLVYQRLCEMIVSSWAGIETTPMGPGGTAAGGSSGTPATSGGGNTTAAGETSTATVEQASSVTVTGLSEHEDSTPTPTATETETAISSGA